MGLLDDILVTFQNPSQAAHSLPGILKKMYYQETPGHTAIISPSRSRSPSATSPDIVAFGPMLGLKFTVDTDEAFRMARLPLTYFGGGKLHVHWTKGADVDASGQTVRWVVEYSVVNNEGELVAPAEYVLELNDTYDDAGLATRHMYRAGDVPMPGLASGYYVFFRVRALTPGSGTPLATPTLVSLDMTWTDRVNEDPTD